MQNHKEQLFELINNSDKKFLGNCYPEYGQIVIRGAAMGAPYDFDHAVGYIVQVREKRGAYGSEQYLVRHPNGELHTHENQSFWLLNEEHQEQALALFAQKPTEEGGDTVYTVAEGFPESGYIIPFKEGAPKSENQHLTMAITITENK
ncbi:hypothetical protein [Vibrio penaeicida]|uniref:hypothetical protein n=1 Tax=Vibrio penaeicida TaxID=104609 RepID=UPI001CC44CE9|nr:hypothetical protein [Vibrio penaeicida]